MSNGVDTGPLADWAIVLTAGRALIGAPAGGVRLSPVYELQCEMRMIQPDPRKPPQLATLRQVSPLLTYPSIKSVDVPAGAIVIPVADLSDKERRDLARSVEACEELIGQMRAQESGIVLAPAGTRLP